MGDVNQEIVAWLHQQQDWLQDAAEQLLERGGVDGEAIKRLAKRLKTKDGQRVTRHRVFKGLSGARSSVSDLRLVSIGGVQGIENLCPQKQLDFGTGNLTVIYGHNGSGKSGYTRILKKASGQPRAQDLVPNVFEDHPETSQCKITFSVCGKLIAETWNANDDALGDLEQIDIFDGETAEHYLCEESEASYIPPPVALFEALARICDKVRTLLQTEMDGLASSLPDLPQEYAEIPAGKAYRNLNSRQSADSLKAVLEWSTEDQETLDSLSERMKAKDPAALAKHKRARKREILVIAQALSKAQEAFGREGIDDLRAIRQNSLDKRTQATEAARVNTASARLGGIGTDTWNALWEAAREYSIRQAYPEQTYPVTEDQARCVLCHQELDDDAKRRFEDFDRYVQGEMETAAKTAESEYQTAVANLPSVPSDNQLRTQCEAAGLDDESWHTKLCGYWNEIKNVRDEITSGLPDESYSGITISTSFIDNLTAMANALEEQAVQHRADAEAFDRESVIDEVRKMEAKRWTSQQADAIRDEIERLKQIEKLEDWKRLAHTRKVSAKADEISERAITDAYVSRFNDELSDLGAQRLKVGVKKTRIERGKAKHRIQLKGLKSGNAAPDSVLSDGERRVVALAAFLADVTGKPDAAPFFFDDPISSLDHEFEWHVAMRLAKLAQDRQVVVMTHRLSLYGAMEDVAKKLGDDWKKKNLTQLCIESFAGSSGHPADKAVWNANTKTANNILLNRLDEAKKYCDSDDNNAYKIHAQGICTDFRRLLERTVEDDLLNQIIRRHRRSVTTDNRIGRLPNISREDCTFIDDLMTKYSCYEHSQSDETPTFLPGEPELRQDLEALRDWRDEFAKRSLGPEA